MSEGTPDPNTLQRRAADPTVSAWVDASAGSGKTKVLTDRVLALLLAGAPPHKILCLTFTKAAAGEMANRIANRLSAWARLPEPDLVRDLADLREATPEAAEIDNARRLFARVQEAPGGVRIDTMHAFCQSVLQRFPIEAKVPPHFDVLDERDQHALLAQARDGLVLDVAAAPCSPLAAAWSRTLERLTERGFDTLMQEIVKHRGRLQETDDHTVAEALGIAPTLTAEQVREAACQDEACDRQVLQSLIEPLMGGSPTVQNIAAALATWLETHPEGRDLSAYTDALLNKDRTPTNLQRFKPLNKDPDLHATIATEQEQLAAVFQDIAKIEALADTRALLAVAAALLDRYASAKAVRSRLDYDDLIEGAAHLLVDPGAAWVHYKLDGGIDHVLVDEAQDTSPAQWQVIASLISEFFAGEAAREQPRTFFAVGDPKQSIYGFQGADPAEFKRRRISISADVRQSGQEWRDVPLNVSFRSAPPVLQFLDAVFENTGAMGLGPDMVTHFPHRKDAPGWIEVWPLAKMPEAAASDDIWRLPDTYDATVSAEEQLARTVAAKIKHLVESGEVLAATGKAISPGDIMVLVRRRRQFGRTLINALKRLDVPVAGLDRMALARQLVVQDLTAFGQFLLMPSDDLNLAAVLKGPFFAWSEERLFALAHGREGTLWAALRAAETAGDQADGERLRRWLRLAPVLSPFALYSRLLVEEQGRTAIHRYLGPEADDPLNEFLALALAYPQHGVPTLQHFLQWLNADNIEIKRELDQGQQNEVRLLTVHAAKGLQAPIVFLPDTGYETQGSRDILTWSENGAPIWRAASEQVRDPASTEIRKRDLQRSLEEESRLLYVALTRAEDRLYVSGWKSRREGSDETWYPRIIRACETLSRSGIMQARDFCLEGLEGSGFVMGSEPTTVGAPAGLADNAIAEPLPPWAQKPVPPEAEPGRPLAPSRPDPPPPAARSPLRDRAAEARRFRRGTLLHRLFQFLPGIPAERRLETAARVLADADLPPDELAQHVASAAKVLDDPAFAAIFGPEALSEAPLTGLVDGQAVSGVVDRLLVTPAKVLVVDYKTNRAPPTKPESIPASYRRQMQTYARLLAGIYPGREIQTALLWTEAPRLDIVALPPSVN